MPVAANGILQAEFDPAWATTSLIVDGGMWPSAVTRITITRSVAGVSDITVRGVDRRPVVGGFFIGSDPEMPLDSTVAYTVTGYSAAGAVVGTSTVEVSTAGTDHGVFLKIAGRPNSLAFTKLASVGPVTTDTQGGLYQIAGGYGVGIGEFGGINAASTTIVLRACSAAEDRSLEGVLDQSRILLIQPSAGIQPFAAGWYYVSRVGRALRAQSDGIEGADWTLDIQATGIPSGAGQGIVGWSWAGLLDENATWAAVIARYPSWFSATRGPS